MSVINILSPHVADLIAAGEVVERPASVVKELVENSIDAGARTVSVEIRGGGMELIRVTDDGSGMSPEDAGVAFLRHATSKLRDERGLECIGTLGFRGEALAAISSVSHIELLTRERGAESGTRVTLTAGDIDEMGPAGCPEGTSMTVRGLFYNTPARLKFMKSDRAEASACCAMALRCALGHPEVSVRMIKDGEEVFFSPGDGRPDSAVYSLLGRETAAGFIACEGESDGASVRGFVSAPHAGRGNRAMQFFFINGRAFKSAAMQAALEQAYKNTLLTGRFPGCVLYIELGFGRVDVNVHPTKAEVKFSDEKKVFDCVYSAVRAALGTERKTAEIELSAQTRRAVQPNPDFYRRMTVQELREASAPAVRERAPERAFSAPPAPMRRETAAPGHISLHQDLPEYGTSPLVPRPLLPRAVPGASEQAAGPTISAPEPSEPETESLVPPPPDVRVIGEAMNTYIIAETADGLLLIDKHAAHERMIFDRITARDGAVMSQSLIEPVTWSPGAETAELLAENAELLSSAGFEIESFGDGSVIVRAVPADTDGTDVGMLEEIAEVLSSGSDLTERRSAVMHTIACKAAIKAGMDTDPAERLEIVRRVASGEIRYCPHGRPVSVKLTRRELDRQFKRIV